MTAPLTNIVFTRNRPLQLAGYLESFLKHMGRCVEAVHVIYKVDRFADEYEQVFAAFPRCRVWRETDFHRDFMDAFNALTTDYVIFATDDVVYFDAVDFDVIHEAFQSRRDLFGFTLKFGPEYFADGREPILEERIAGQPVYRVRWTTARDPAAKYPFELNSTVYTRAFVRHLLDQINREHPVLQRVFAPGSPMLKVASLFTSPKHLYQVIHTFHDPNNLEGYGWRWCRGRKRRLPDYLYFQRICATTLQVNRVNTVVPNPVYGTEEHSIEALNAKFKEGYRLDLRILEENKPTWVRAGAEHFRLVRPADQAGS